MLSGNPGAGTAGNCGGTFSRGEITEDHYKAIQASAKTLTAGFRQLMEGLGGLQEPGPILEQQRRQQQQEGN